MTISRQVRLVARPVGLPKRTDWSLTDEPVGAPAGDNFLVKIRHISRDPALRGWMNAGRSYILPAAIGELMRALAFARATASKHPGFAVGDYVSGPFRVQEYAVSDGKLRSREDIL